MARALALADGGSDAAPFRRMGAAPAAVPSWAAAPMVQAQAAPAVRGLAWDAYKAGIAGAWNNTDQVHGFSALAQVIGYTGPIQERTGRQVVAYEGESGTVYADEWGPAPAFEKAMRAFRFEATKDGDGNGAVTVSNAAGVVVSTNRIASSAGSMLKAAGIIIPALVSAGFAAALAPLLAPLLAPTVSAPAAALGGADTAGAFIFNAAADSQIASTALGITGAQAAAAAIVPAAVDLGTLGGIVSTAAAPVSFVDAIVKAVSEFVTPAPALAADPAPFIFNAAADSQIASTALGITGAQAAAAATVPAFVNLGSLGGIVSTAAAPGLGWLGSIAGTLGDAALTVAKTVGTGAATRALTEALTPDAADGAPTYRPPTTTTPQAMPGGLLALILGAAALLLN